MDQISLERLQALHPKIRQEAIEDYTHINNKLFGKRVRLRIAYARRTKEEQTALYAQGRTVLFDKKGKRLGKVTNAQWWQTMHFYCLAIDIVVLYDIDGNGTFEVASWDLVKDMDADGQSDWMEAVNYLRSRGWEWGGSWKFKDAPHFQKTFGHTWQSLYKKWQNGDTFVENGITYVNI